MKPTPEQIEGALRARVANLEAACEAQQSLRWAVEEACIKEKARNARLVAAGKTLRDWVMVEVSTEYPSGYIPETVRHYDAALADQAPDAGKVATHPDTARLDSRKIKITFPPDEWGNTACVYHDIDLRAAIDSAIKGDAP